MLRLIPTGALLLMMLAGSPAWGQTTTATVQGTVKDASQAILPGATVTLKNDDTGFTRSTATDQHGRYYLANVPVGAYTMTVELSNFRTESRRGLRLEVGQEYTIDVALELASVAEQVTVTGEAPAIEPTKSTVDAVIRREQVDNLPVAGRQAANLAMLAPGVVPRGSVEEPVTSEGQPRGSGEFLLDGVSNKLVLVNSIRSNAPPDAVQEFQVLTSQYQAEYGNASGIVLNTITRSGTNTLRGRGYYFHRDENLDAKNVFQTSKARFEQKQGGGWIGGPIVRDRTHYFASLELTRRETVAVVNTPMEKGDVKQPFDNNQVLAKVTHQVNPANLLSFRFSVDRPFYHKLSAGGTNRAEIGIDYLTKDYAYVGSLSTVVSNQSLNELRVQVSDAGIKIDTPNPDAFTVIRPSSLSGKFSNQPQAIPEMRYQIVDNFSHEIGAHRLKFGLDFNRITADGYLYQNNPGVFTFATDREFNTSDLSTYPITFITNIGDVNFKFVLTSFSFFAQDAWHLPNNLTLNLGVRSDSATMTGTDLQKGNLAPRLGLAWDPFGDGKTSVRAGYGMFYNSLMFNVPIFTSFFANQRTVLITNPGYPDPYSRGTPGNVPISTYFFEDNQPVPRSYNATVGIQRELVKGLTVGADYVNAKGRKLIRIVDTNPVTPPAFTRPDPTRGFVRVLESTGYSNYQGLLLGATLRFGERGQIAGAYTLASYKTTTEAENGVFQQDDLNKDDSYGYGNFDQRHRIVLNGTYRLPYGVQIGGVLMARSGVPVNITTGTDNNRNGVTNDRPDLVSGEVGTSDMFNRNNLADPGGRAGNLPRNAARGPKFWQLDLRVSKTFDFANRHRLELLVEAFNIDNHVNYFNEVGNLRSGNFGKSIGADIARQVQLGVRYGF